MISPRAPKRRKRKSERERGGGGGGGSEMLLLDGHALVFYARFTVTFSTQGLHVALHRETR